jgi:hypothetical protein
MSIVVYGGREKEEIPEVEIIKSKIDNKATNDRETEKDKIAEYVYASIGHTYLVA